MLTGHQQNDNKDRSAHKVSKCQVGTYLGGAADLGHVRGGRQYHLDNVPTGNN